LKPALLVIAGPNGASKTTVTTRFRADDWSGCVEHLNADDTARDRFGERRTPRGSMTCASRLAAAWRR
jgi:predicted ABC-type ATPase